MSLFRRNLQTPPPVPPVARPRPTPRPTSDAVERLVVIDTETTGLYNSDRIVEVAAVVMNDQLKVIDEFDTLVNPQRDVGPTRIHGITGSMVSAAPTFGEVASALAQRIEGSVLVAHNLPFDSRFLVNEYGRVGAMLTPGEGICTLRLSRRKLDVACQQYGIEIGHHHRALADARATAKLLRCLVRGRPSGVPASVRDLTTTPSTRTLRRDATHHGTGGTIPKLIRSARFPTADGDVIAYLDMLDLVLDDGIITEIEAESLEELAAELGLSTAQVENAHRSYFDEILVAAIRDQRISDEENHLLGQVASALGLDPRLVPSVTPPVTASGATLGPGTGVCFTGEATDKRGRTILRSELQGIAERAGLAVLQNVTKKCGLLVAADPSSMSGKARKAHEYGIPIMSVDEFLAAVGAP